MDWLDRPDVLSDYANWDEEQARLNELLSEEEIEKMLQERMQEQNEEHNGGQLLGGHPRHVHLRQLRPVPPRASGWGARGCTAGPSGWRGSGNSGTSGRTTPWTPANSRWP